MRTWTESIKCFQVEHHKKCSLTSYYRALKQGTLTGGFRKDVPVMFLFLTW